MCLADLFQVCYFQSCLVLRYEALLLRELHAAGDPQLYVSYREWVTFAEHALENRFYAIARKVTILLMDVTLKDQ